MAGSLLEGLCEPELFILEKIQLQGSHPGGVSAVTVIEHRAQTWTQSDFGGQFFYWGDD